MYDGIVQDLIDEFGRLPGIGPKSAQRIAFHILQTPTFDVSRLSHLLGELRERVQHGDLDPAEEHQRLRLVEAELDQCWDLLRQRRALRETGGDPREAQVRPAGEVEGYLS